MKPKAYKYGIMGEKIYKAPYVPIYPKMPSEWDRLAASIELRTFDVRNNARKEMWPCYLENLRDSLARLEVTICQFKLEVISELAKSRQKALLLR